MKKLLSLVLTLSLLLSLPVFSIGVLEASATDENFYIGNIALKDGDILVSGRTSTSTYDELEATNYDFVNGSYAYRSHGNVFLNNFKYEGAGYGASGSRKAVIRGYNIDLYLFGKNEIVCTTAGGVGIYCDGTFFIDTCYAEVPDYSMGELRVTADFPIMLYTTTSYAPQYYQKDGHVTLKTSVAEGVGIALYTETTNAYVDVLSGYLNIEGSGSRSAIEAITTLDGQQSYFESGFADVFASGFKKGIVVDEAKIYGTFILMYADEYGIDALGGEVSMSDAYIDITVAEKWGCCIRGDIVTMNGYTMYVGFGSVAERMYVAYPRAYVQIGNFYLYDGEYLGGGGYKTTSKPSSGGYAYFTGDAWGGNLELYNFGWSDTCEAPVNRDDYWADDTCIYSLYNLELTINGNNYLEPDDGCYAMIVYGSLRVDGEGTLNIGKQTQTRYEEYCAGIKLYSDYYTSDTEFTINSGNINSYSLDGVEFINLTKGLENTFTVNGGKHRFGAVYLEGYISKGKFIMNGGEFKLLAAKRLALDIYGTTGSGFVQNGGIFEIECSESFSGIAVQVAIDGKYDVAEGFEIYGGEFIVKSASGEDIITTYCTNPILGSGVEIVEGDWDSDYIRIAQSSVPGPGPSDDVLLGDVNGDGAIDQFDYILVKRHYFGTRILTESEMVPADVNKDGNVDQFDYILIKRHYFGTYVIGG